jgi:hypothetical protein
MIQTRVLFSVICLIMFQVFVYVSRPEIIYTKRNKLKQFGFGKGKTILSMGVIVAVFSIITFFAFSMMDIMFI